MNSKLRHGLLAALATVMLAVGALAQQPPAIGKQQLFPTPDAAADALNDAAKRGDGKALEAILGAPWSALTPLQSDGFKRDLAAYFSQWDKQHKVTIDSASNGAKAIVEAVANFNDPKVLARVSENLGAPMVGINCDDLKVRYSKREGGGMDEADLAKAKKHAPHGTW